MRIRLAHYVIKCSYDNGSREKCKLYMTRNNALKVRGLLLVFLWKSSLLCPAAPRTHLPVETVLSSNLCFASHPLFSKPSLT